MNVHYSTMKGGLGDGYLSSVVVGETILVSNLVYDDDDDGWFKSVWLWVQTKLTPVAIIFGFWLQMHRCLHKLRIKPPGLVESILIFLEKSYFYILGKDMHGWRLFFKALKRQTLLLNSLQSFSWKCYVW